MPVPQNKTHTASAPSSGRPFLRPKRTPACKTVHNHNKRKQGNLIQKDSLFKVTILFIRVASCAKRITSFFVSFRAAITSSWLQACFTVLISTVLFLYFLTVFLYFRVLTSGPMTQASTLYLMTSEMHVSSLGLTTCLATALASGCRVLPFSIGQCHLFGGRKKFLCVYNRCSEYKQNKQIK